MRVRTWGVVFALALVACGETNREAIDKMKPEYAPLRARLAKIHDAIAAMAPTPSTVKADVAPPPVFDQMKKEFNADIVSFEQLADIDAKPRFDLIASGELVLGLQYTGEHNPAAASMLAERHGKEMEDWMRKALQTRYLLVYRTVGLMEPTVLDEHTFTPGQVALALYVVDLANGDKVQSMGGITGHTAPATEYAYKKGEDQKERLGAFAHSTLWESVRKEVPSRVQDATGGRVVFQ